MGPLQSLNAEESDAMCKIFDELQEAHPKSDSIKRLLLYFLSGELFTQRLDKYLRPRIRKGIPSLFRTLKPLYGHEGKGPLIEKLLLQYSANLSKDDSYFDEQAEGDEEPPSSLLFTTMMV